MPLEIERDRDIARLCEGERISFHQLTGAREAVSDDDGRNVGRTSALIDCRRSRADPERRDRQTRALAFETPNTEQTHQETCKHRYQAQIEQAQTTPEPVPQTTEVCQTAANTRTATALAIMPSTKSGTPNPLYQMALVIGDRRSRRIISS